MTTKTRDRGGQPAALRGTARGRAGRDAQGFAEPTALDGAPIAPDAVIGREVVPPGWYATIRLRRGEALRIVDDAGTSSASLIGWRAEDMSERINCADTVKVQWSAAISKGRVILSDMGRVLLSVIEDTSGAHDLLVGGSTPASTAAAYGSAGRNTHDNFLGAAAKVGLGLRDIPPCATFFAPVSVDAKGRFVWNGGRKRAGDFVDLRAEMNLGAGGVELSASARSGAARRDWSNHAHPPPRACSRHG